MRVEKCYILKQEGDLLIGMKNNEMVYIPLHRARVFSQALEENRLVCVNDLNKERDYTRQMRDSLGIKSLYNYMVIPIGKSMGKYGGAHVLILINRVAQSLADDEKTCYENFNVYLQPCYRPVFKQLLAHVISHNDINIAR